jgi:protein-S-isoprenylcysteine O-methyltransferase Ste14
MDVDQDSAGVSFPPPLAFIGTLLAGLALDRFMWWTPGIPLGHWFVHALGLTAVIVGAAILLTAIGLFRKAGTDPKPWKTPSSFVTDGVYRWTRNPMYLGMALIYAGIALRADSLVTLLLLIPVLLWIRRNVIDREEAYMETRFGEPYRAYKGSVRRWF